MGKRILLTLTTGASLLFAIYAGATNNGYTPAGVGTHGCVAGGTCYYINPSDPNASDNNNGLSKTYTGIGSPPEGPWKHVPGMIVNGTDCVTVGSVVATKASNLQQTDEFIIKGGETFPFACLYNVGSHTNWTMDGGGASIANSYDYPGWYLGYDPTWNDGTVTHVVVYEPGVCSHGTTLTVNFTGGGGGGATGTAHLARSDVSFTNDTLQFISVTNPGAGYTTNPSVSFTVTSGSCAQLPQAAADIYSPIIDGSAGIFGDGSNMNPQRMFTITNARRATVDHLDFGHYKFWADDACSQVNPDCPCKWGTNMLAIFSQDVVFRNLFVHDWQANVLANYTDACNDSSSTMLYGNGDPNGDTLNNSVFNNWESSLAGFNVPKGAEIYGQGTAVNYMQYVTNSIISGMRGGVYTISSSLSYVVAGNLIFSINADANQQHEDATYFHSGGLFYNNKIRDIFSGAPCFYEELVTDNLPMTSYFFNNVTWNCGWAAYASTAEFSTSGFAGTSHHYWYNNTSTGAQINSPSDSSCFGAGQWPNPVNNPSAYDFGLANNHCISTQAVEHWYASVDATGCTNGCGTWNGNTQPNSPATRALIDPTAVVQTPTQANSDNYKPEFGYAPRSGNAGTVAFASNPSSTNLTSLCSQSLGGNSLAPLCKDILNNQRPTSGGWQAGAYSYPPSSISSKFYVSLTGNDSNSGLSPTDAVRTIDKGRQLLAGTCLGNTGPSILYIDGTSPDPTHPERPATYYLGDTLGTTLEFLGNSTTYPSTAGQGDSGCSETVPNIYWGYNFPVVNDYPVYPTISGGMRITSWTTTGTTGGSGVTAWTQYSADCTSPCTYFETLYYNGERRMRPQAGTTVVTGTATTSGTAVTLTGTTVNQKAWPNATLTINGTLYQVDSAASSTSLSLKNSAGTQTAVPYVSFTLSNLGTNYKSASTGGGALVQKTDACSLTGYGCNGATNSTCRTTNSANSNYCDDRFRYDSTIDLSGVVPINLSGTTDCTATGHNFGTLIIYFENWATPLMPLCAIDTVNKIVILTGEFLDANLNSAGSAYGPVNSRRFIIENYPTGSGKITQAKQWFLDRTVTPNKIYYNAAVGENPNNDVVDVPVVFPTLRLFNVQWNTFRNVAIGEDNYVVPDGGVTNPEGKPDMPTAVSIQNSNFVNIESSDITHTSAGALDILTCRSNTTDRSWCRYFITGAAATDIRLHQLSLTDIGINGFFVGTRLPKNNTTTDSDTNIPMRISFTDNLTAGYGRRYPGAVGYGGAVARDLDYAHNDCYDGYHSCIAYAGPNTNFGTGHGLVNWVTQYNHLRQAPQGVLGDDGMLYMGNGTGNHDPTGSCSSGNKILHNLIHDVNDPLARYDSTVGGYGSSGLYVDNQGCNVELKYNVVYRVGEAGFRMTKGTPIFTSGKGATGPNVIQNNVMAYMRIAAIKVGGIDVFASSPDYGADPPPGGGSPTNCPAASKRMQVLVKNNVFYADRDHAVADGDEFYMQQGCASSCGFTYADVFHHEANLYYNKLHTSTYNKYMHVAHTTPNPVGGPSSACTAVKGSWDFAAPSCWQTGTVQSCPTSCYKDVSGVCSTPVVASAGEDAGSSFFTDPGFVSPGYPNDNYHLTCPLAVAGINCNQINDTLDNAGRLTHKNYNPIVPQTFSTAVWDPAHTNNGDY